MAKPKAALYHRVSTVDQRADAARSELRDAAKRYGYRVALDVEETGVVSHRGVTGRRRPRFAPAW